LLLLTGDPSVLRFLIAAREEVDSTQLRDDLLSMLVAGHETTGSALTWTLYLLAQNPQQMQKAQVCHCGVVFCSGVMVCIR
jgi:carotene epsilon-monooxygenase